MNWPGENLLIALWVTLTERGVGGLLKPWQIRREGVAQIDVRRYEILMLANAEREAEEIRIGKRRLEDGNNTIFLTSEIQDEACNMDTGTASEQPAIRIATKSAIADSLRKEINVVKSVLHAENELKEDPTPPADKKIEADWLYRWRDCAGSVSADELQAIWGRILAGELKSPGSYSYRLLEFVKNLTKDEAQLIEKIAPFVIADFIAKNPESALADENLSFTTFLVLQELGVVAGVEAIGIAKIFDSSTKGNFTRILCCHGRGLLIEHSDEKKKLELPAYLITSLGRQVIKLGKFKPNEKYLRALGTELKRAGFTVSLCDYADAENKMVRYFNKEELK